MQTPEQVVPQYVEGRAPRRREGVRGMRVGRATSRRILAGLVPILAAAALAFPAAGELALVGGQLDLVPASSGYPRDPAVAAADDGWALVWNQHVPFPGTPGSSAVFARRLDDTASPTGEPFRVDADEGFVERIVPDVAGSYDGSFAVVWHDIHDRETWARGFDALDRPLGPSRIVNVTQAHWQIYAALAPAPSGGYVAAWVTRDVGDDGVPWPPVADARRLDAAARPVGSEMRVNFEAEADGRALDLAVGLEGEILVAWHWWRSEPEIWLRRLAADGTPLGPELVAAERVNPEQRPAVCALSGGRFLLAWSGEGGVQARPVEADGTLAETRSIDAGAGYHAGPRLGCTRFGEIVVAYRTLDGEIVARELDVHGAPRGEPLVVSADDGRFRGLPNVAIGSSGRALVVWPSAAPDDTPGATPETGIDGRLIRLGPEACEPSATALCLGGGRFRARALWRNPYAPGSGIAQAGPLRGDSGTLWFFRPDNLETVVKVLDGRPVNGHHWVFTGSLSTLEQWIEVTETASGRSRVYHDPPRVQTSRADTAAFADRPSAPASRMPSSPVPAGFHPEVGADAALCVPSATRLCLGGGRFAIEVDWTANQLGTSGPGRPIRFTADTGAFWFFREGNLELMVKVLDGRPVNGRFWVLWAGLTSVEYELRVHDLVAGRTHVYPHPEGTPSAGADTALEP